MLVNVVKKMLRAAGLDLRRHDRALDHYRRLYRKYELFTMVPEQSFVANLELCARFTAIDGDYVECGVWRGGVSAGIAEILGRQRTFHLFDSFEGLPPAKEIDGPAAISWQNDTTSSQYFDNCKAERGFAEEAFRLAGHERVLFYEGWFDKTVPSFPRVPIGILRLDGDWYDSIKVCLEQLFPLVTPGGVIILDDYYTWDGCARAVHEYLGKSGTTSRIHQMHDGVAFIVK